MRKMAASSLISEAVSYLARKQAEIDALPDYAARVEAAKRLWKSKDSEIFKAIRARLREIGPGIGRCHYCEDSAADEVEHVWPKSLYPELAFVWSNYLFACGICNGTHKGDQFAIFDATGHIKEQARPSKAPVLPPLAGEPVFLDPHLVDPLNYLEFDPGTGEFVETGEEGQPDFHRAEYTIKILGLNRDILTKQRKLAYRTWLALARDYAAKRNTDAPQTDLLQARSDIEQLPFPGMRESILRHAGEHPEIAFFPPELIGTAN